MGIYQITNLENGKKYIGMSNNIKRRFMEHKAPKNFNKNRNVIYKSIRKYGIECFRFEILEEINTIQELPNREIYWIDKIKPEYNMNLGGLGNCGYVVRSETKEKLRRIGKLQWSSLTDEEKKLRIKNNLKGPKANHEVSEQTRQLLAIHNLGKKQSEETKRKRSESMKIATIGNKNGNKRIVAIKDGITTEYSSIKEASIQTGVCTWGIRQVTKQLSLTSKGFQFKIIK